MPARASTRTTAWKDVRELTRLLASLAAFARGSDGQYQHFLESSVRLLNARVGVLLRASVAPDRPLVLSVLHSWGWLEDRARAIFLKDAREHLYRGNPFLPRFTRSLLQRASQPLARVRRQLVRDGAWYHSNYVQTTFRSLDLDDLIVGAAPVAPASTWVWTAFLRSWGDRRGFGERESRLALLMAEAMSIVLALKVSGGSLPPIDDTDGRAAANLPRRLHEVRALLLQGLSEKEVARSLQLSPATVHRHVNRLYKLLAISSRAELFHLEGPTR